MNFPLFVNSDAKESIVIMLEAGTWRLSTTSLSPLALYIDNVLHSDLKHSDSFTLKETGRVSLRRNPEAPPGKISASIYKWDSQAPN